MEFNGGRPSEDSSGQELTPIVWRVKNVPPGVDPRAVIGVPQKDSLLTMFGTVFKCDRVDTPQHINESTYKVATYFSTNGSWDSLPDTRLNDDTRNFQGSYKKIDIPAPNFYVEPITYTNAAGAELSEIAWRREDTSFPIEFDVLSVNIVLDVENDSQILAYLAQAKAQIGHYHIFPYSPSTIWRMLPIEYNRLAKKLTISYAWESDPGNGPMKVPGEYENEIILPPRRRPFHIYQVIKPDPADTFMRKPRIIDVPLYDTTDTTYYTPNGYIGLPGNPI